MALPQLDQRRLGQRLRMHGHGGQPSAAPDVALIELVLERGTSFEARPKQRALKPYDFNRRGVL